MADIGGAAAGRQRAAAMAASANDRGGAGTTWATSVGQQRVRWR